MLYYKCPISGSDLLEGNSSQPKSCPTNPDHACSLSPSQNDLHSNKTYLHETTTDKHHCDMALLIGVVSKANIVSAIAK